MIFLICGTDTIIEIHIFFLSLYHFDNKYLNKIHRRLLLKTDKAQSPWVLSQGTDIIAPATGQSETASLLALDETNLPTEQI
jgi:hypothetical protein